MQCTVWRPTKVRKEIWEAKYLQQEAVVTNTDCPAGRNKQLTPQKVLPWDIVQRRKSWEWNVLDKSSWQGQRAQCISCLLRYDNVRRGLDSGCQGDTWLQLGVSWQRWRHVFRIQEQSSLWQSVPWDSSERHRGLVHQKWCRCRNPSKQHAHSITLLIWPSVCSVHLRWHFGKWLDAVGRRLRHL